MIRGADAVDIRYHDGTSARVAWGVERTSFDRALAEHAARSGARVLELRP